MGNVSSRNSSRLNRTKSFGEDGKRSSTSKGSKISRREPRRTKSSSTASVNSLASSDHVAVSNDHSRATTCTTAPPKRREKIICKPPVTKNEKIVTEWFTRWSNQDMAGAKEVSDPKCRCYFVEANAEMLFTDFCDNMEELFKSFPDYCITWESLTEDPATGLVTMMHYDSVITHSGAPFGFGGYTPIPAKSPPVVVNDHIPKIVCHVKDNRVSLIEVYAGEALVGLPGIYQAIGGIVF